MGRELITVAIPVYRVEAYLEKCVDSVLRQTYEDLEVILVDDGSPDGCPALCDALAARDSRVRVIHQKNGGLAAARNAGIDAARGAFMGFVDSDDYIAPDMFEKLRAALGDTGADMSVCGYKYVDESGAPVRELPPLAREVLPPEEVLRRMERPLCEWRFVTAVNRLCRRELFDGLRLPAGKLYEDEFLAPRLIARCASIATIPDEPYFYVQRGDSIMGSPMSVRRLDAVEAYLERYDFYRERNMTGLAASALYRAYEILWQVIDGLDMEEHGSAVRPWVRRVAAAQLRRLDPRAAWLMLHYIRAAARRT